MSISRSTWLAAITCSAACLALWGCAGSLDRPERFQNLGSAPDSGTGGSSDGGCEPLIDIFPPSCSTSACHSAQSQQGNLDLESPGLPDRLVNKQAHGGPGKIIDSANPLQSVILTKLSDPPPFQFQMPLGAAPLSSDEVACLQSWVEAAVAPP
ncbi:MAG TPA: hypothetical protein VMK66_04105 [Myxococcales bacterium]|nr:hypothetical protein [Myxococcales bacterium]